MRQYINLKPNEDLSYVVNLLIKQEREKVRAEIEQEAAEKIESFEK